MEDNAHNSLKGKLGIHEALRHELKKESYKRQKNASAICMFLTWLPDIVQKTLGVENTTMPSGS